MSYSKEMRVRHKLRELVRSDTMYNVRANTWTTMSMSTASDAFTRIHLEIRAVPSGAMDPCQRVISDVLSSMEWRG